MVQGENNKQESKYVCKTIKTGQFNSNMTALTSKLKIMKLRNFSTEVELSKEIHVVQFGKSNNHTCKYINQ